MDATTRLAVRGAVLDALAVLAPTSCSGCGAPDRALCDACRGALRAVQMRMHQVAGEPGRPALPVHCALEYSGVARRVLVALKEAGRTDAASALAPALLIAIDGALRGAGSPGVELAVVPSSRAAFRQRGFHPVKLVLSKAGLRGSRVLRPARQTADQSSLGIAARRANRAGSLVADPRVGGHVFLIVDDILTTGATIAEARRALEEAGAAVVGAAVVAYTRKRLGGAISAP